jgi:hypothetical protein
VPKAKQQNNEAADEVENEQKRVIQLKQNRIKAINRRSADCKVQASQQSRA